MTPSASYAPTFYVQHRLTYFSYLHCESPRDAFSRTLCWFRAMSTKGNKYIVKLNNRELSKTADRINHEVSTRTENGGDGTNIDR